MKRAAVAVLVACGSGTTMTAPLPVTNRAKADALAYELGDGVPRDYRVAAHMDRDACRDGCGDVAACRRYIVLVADERGEIVDGRQYLKLIGRACDRGLAIACAQAAMIGVRDPSKLPDDEHEEQLCMAGDVDACTLALGIGFDQSGAAEDRARRVRRKACELGDLATCGTIFERACEDDGDACLEHHAAAAGQQTDAELRKYELAEVDELRRVLARLRAGCDRGDADACAHVPGRAIAPKALCAAGDFKVCELLAQAGDRDAALTGCRGGRGGDCGVPAVPQLGEMVPVLQLVARNCVNGDQAACDQLHHLAPPCP